MPERDPAGALIRRSRTWSQAADEGELFRAASSVLREVFGVDTGYFVYRRGSILGEPAGPLQVYEPWGVLSGRREEIARRVVRQDETPGALSGLSERWMDLSEVPPEVRSDWERWGVKQGGSWALTFRGERVGAMVLRRARRRAQVDDGDLVSLCAVQTSLVLELISARRAAEEASERDFLTGLWNRRGFLERIAGTTSGGHPALLIGVVDLDNLKETNDELGHPEGDRLLRKTARLLREHLGGSGIACRWGGDEFVILQSAAAPGSPHHAARRLEEHLAAGGVTASAGIAVWGEDGTSWEECYAAADRRLYARKMARQPG
ncbi:MAG: GGDEF domain-containing protein [Rubrobacteraceae bacterium]|nr:GGDEF domain-containing protein [Rubrobacteraceae bacterium]MCL6437161.1 GGDEF domain-containing protein [Rubrobacteraceae bacterium]